MSGPKLTAWSLIGLSALAVACRAEAGTLDIGQCSVTVPDNWTHTSNRAASPNGLIVLQVGESNLPATTINVERAAPGAQVLSSNPALMIIRTIVGGATRYLAVAPPAGPLACTAFVTSRDPNGGGSAAAVAASLRRQQQPPPAARLERGQ